MSDFKNSMTMTDLKHSPWGGYQGQCVGRVIHYLYHYLGYNYADSSIISLTEVKCHGVVVAFLDWSMGYPYFRFAPDLGPNMIEIGERRQNENLAYQLEFRNLMEDFERVMNKALDYAEKDKVFLHNKSCLQDIKDKYFKE
jgi:hypothetical protein